MATGGEFRPARPGAFRFGISNSARVWNVEALVKAFRHSDSYRGHDFAIVTVDFLAGGRKACTVDRFGEVHLWDTGTHELVRRFPPPRISATPLADLDVSPDQRLLAVGTGPYPVGKHPGQICLFDLDTGQMIGEDELPRGFQRGIEFSPTGEVLAFGSGNELQIRSLATFEIMTTLPLDKQTRCVRFSPDGRKLACTTLGGSTYVFRNTGLPHDYKLDHRIQSDKFVSFCVDFSPDGNALITGGGDKVIKMWDARSYEFVKYFEACSNFVTRVLYTPDGERVVSATFDGSIQIWRPRTGAAVWSRRDKVPLLCVNLALSPDGQMFASGVQSTRIWRVPRLGTVFQEPTIDEMGFIDCQSTSLPNR